MISRIIKDEVYAQSHSIIVYFIVLLTRQKTCSLNKMHSPSSSDKIDRSLDCRVLISLIELTMFIVRDFWMYTSTILTLFVYLYTSLTLQPGSATTSDYTNIAQLVTFDPLESSTKSVPVSITNDAIIEDTESFTATLVATTDAFVPNEGRIATVTIIDEDGK